MDASLSPIAPAAALAANSPEPNHLPWETEFSEAPRPAARKVMPRDTGRIEAQPLPWAMVALTLATALLVVFGARAGGVPDSRVMDLAAAHSGN